MGDDTATDSGASTDDSTLVDVDIGTTVYDESGTELGTVRGLDDAGFYVRSTDSTGRVDVTAARDIFGKAYVMWRCWECGAMGTIDDALPAACPDCGAPREELYYWAED